MVDAAREKADVAAPPLEYALDGDVFRWALPSLTVEMERGVLALLAEGCLRDGKRRDDPVEQMGGILFGVHDPTTHTTRVQSVDTYCSRVLADVLRLVTERVSVRGGTPVVGWYHLDRAEVTHARPGNVSAFLGCKEPARILLQVPRAAVEGREATAVFAYRAGEEETVVSAAFPPLPPAGQLQRPALRDSEESAAPKRRRGRRRAVVALALLAGGAEFWRQKSATATPPPEEAAKPAKVAAEPSGVGLFAVQEKNLVKIVWEPKAPEVFHALSATIGITDGGKRTNVLLDGMRLAAGIYWYAPVSSAVSIKMTLIAANGHETEITANLPVKLAPTPPAPPLDKRPEAPAMRIPPLPSPVLPPRAIPGRPPTGPSASPSPTSANAATPREEGRKTPEEGRSVPDTAQKQK